MKKTNTIFRTKRSGPGKGYFTDFSSSHPVAQVDQTFFSIEGTQHAVTFNVINDFIFSS